MSRRYWRGVPYVLLDSVHAVLDSTKPFSVQAAKTRIVGDPNDPVLYELVDSQGNKTFYYTKEEYIPIIEQWKLYPQVYNTLNEYMTNLNHTLNSVQNVVMQNKEEDTNLRLLLDRDGRLLNLLEKDPDAIRKIVRNAVDNIADSLGKLEATKIMAEELIAELEDADLVNSQLLRAKLKDAEEKYLADRGKVSIKEKMSKSKVSVKRLTKDRPENLTRLGKKVYELIKRNLINGNFQTLSSIGVSLPDILKYGSKKEIAKILSVNPRDVNVSFLTEILHTPEGETPFITEEEILSVVKSPHFKLAEFVQDQVDKIVRERRLKKVVESLS